MHGHIVSNPGCHLNDLSPLIQGDEEMAESGIGRHVLPLEEDSDGRILPIASRATHQKWYLKNVRSCTVCLLWYQGDLHNNLTVSLD